jgi:ribose transport system permease protein
MNSLCILRSNFIAIWIATALLFAICALVAPSSLSHSSLLSMLPYAAILSVAAAGQTLVAQQGGIDLSVPGLVSLSAILVTKNPDQSPDLVLPAMIVAIVACAGVGTINGLCIAVGRLTPIVATLGVNALVLGFIQWYSKGFPTPVAQPLADWAFGQLFSIPNTAIVAALIVAIMHIVIASTVVGRRFEAVGASPATAAAANINVRRYIVAAYTSAGVCYAVAGMLLAAYLKSPGIFIGDSYLLPSVAAVVLGGTALTGGVGSVVASAVAALFLTQLGQFVLTIGAPTSAQWIIQAATIVVGMAWRQINPVELIRRLAAPLRGKISSRQHS